MLPRKAKSSPVLHHPPTGRDWGGSDGPVKRHRGNVMMIQELFCISIIQHPAYVAHMWGTSCPGTCVEDAPSGQRLGEDDAGCQQLAWDVG